MNVGIIDSDLLDNGTKFPNLTLMKLSSYEKQRDNKVTLLKSYSDLNYDKIYLSKVFDYTTIPDNVLSLDNVEYEGTGFYYDKSKFLPDHIEHSSPDYDLYSDMDGEYYNDYSMK